MNQNEITNQNILSDLAQAALTSSEALRMHVRALTLANEYADLETFKERMVEECAAFIAGLDESYFEKILFDDRDAMEAEMSQDEYETEIASTY